MSSVPLVAMIANFLVVVPSFGVVFGNCLFLLHEEDVFAIFLGVQQQGIAGLVGKCLHVLGTTIGGDHP